MNAFGKIWFGSENEVGGGAIEVGIPAKDGALGLRYCRDGTYRTADGPRRASRFSRSILPRRDELFHFSLHSDARRHRLCRHGGIAPHGHAFNSRSRDSGLVEPRFRLA